MSPVEPVEGLKDRSDVVTGLGKIAGWGCVRSISRCEFGFTGERRHLWIFNPVVEDDVVLSNTRYILRTAVTPDSYPPVCQHNL
ncbi:hypothetical protein COCON_G00033390 [Conger conger]|uniref:Uncharacterized protein n=1 Tax=Conger conger TaxID=82655 RepID=A0A9Q1I6J6_CONCO|nr:hypothetical protein COCON_G00033390 [Conger conger]